MPVLFFLHRMGKKSRQSMNRRVSFAHNLDSIREYEKNALEWGLHPAPAAAAAAAAAASTMSSPKPR
jgi:hypothetical protein